MFIFVTLASLALYGYHKKTQEPTPKTGVRLVSGKRAKVGIENDQGGISTIEVPVSAAISPEVADSVSIRFEEKPRPNFATLSVNAGVLVRIKHSSASTLRLVQPQIPSNYPRVLLTLGAKEMLIEKPDPEWLWGAITTLSA